MRLELALAWAGMRHRPGRWLLLALGIALATALPVVAAGMRAEATVAAVRSAIHALPESRRVVLAVTARDLRAGELVAADQPVTSGFADAGLTSIRRALTFRPLAAGGVTFTIGAVDGLATDVRLTEGRLPRTCTPTACEVVAVAVPGNNGAPEAAAFGRAGRQLGIVVTGTGDLVDQRLIGTRLVAPDTPLLLGAEPAQLANLEALQLFGRNTSWYASLEEDTVAAQGVAAFARALDGIPAAVNPAAGPLSVAWPAGAIQAAAERAQAAADRLAVLGTAAGALQLGFCVVVAAGMRRRQQLTRHVLDRRGISPARLAVVTLLQPLLPVLVGAVSGVALGAGVVAAYAAALNADTRAVAWQAVGTSWPAPLALSALAVAVTATVVRWPERAGRATRLVLDAALVAALGGVALVLAGATGNANSPLVGILVVLVALATGLLAARLWGAVLHLLLGGDRRRRPQAGQAAAMGRVAFLGGLRRPLLPTATAGFLAAACCVLVFAGAYRASLMQSAADQAAAQVPLDVRVGPSADVGVPSAVVNGERLRALSPDISVYPVVSSTVTAFPGTPRVSAVPLTGVDPPALAQMHNFQATTGADLTAAQLADLLAGDPGTDAHAPVIPAGTRRISVEAQGTGTAVTLGVWVATPDGTEFQVRLTERGSQLSGTLDPGPELVVRAVEIAESPARSTHRQHGVGEGRTDRPLTAGVLRLGTAQADGAPLAWPWRSWTSQQARLTFGRSPTVAVRYQIGDRRVILTPGAPDYLAGLAVATDVETAARAGTQGTFGISVNQMTVQAKVVAVLPHLPTVGHSFVLADRAAVVALLDSAAPGTAAVSQVWISAPEATVDAVQATLEASPAVTATLGYRAELARTILADPVATRSMALLGVGGGIALALAVAAAASSVLADRDESAASLFALELDGMTVAALRGLLALRSGSAVLLAVPVGVLGGSALTAAVVRLVAIGPAGVAVEPPLRMVLGVASTVGVAALAVVGGVAAVVLGSVVALRGPLPRGADLDLR